MRVIAAGIAALALAAGPVSADGEKAGDFDYYVLALSWSPAYCVLEGDAQGQDQCDPRHDFGFTLHGLWPQYENGWPAYCQTGARDPSRAETRAMADIMGSDGLAWYQWKKHGRCSGLSAQQYFAAARQAYRAVHMPEVFGKLQDDVRLPAHVVEEAFLEANPGLKADMITVTCDAGLIREAHVCLDRDLQPRACSADIARDCTLPKALMKAVR